jgi:putative ABC transport system substrate-binding protein
MWYSTLGCIVILALGMLVPPLAADAQHAGKVARIGYLSGVSSSGSPRQFVALREGLREFGWLEGQNLVIEARWAEGRPERLPELAAELVHLNVHVIVAAGPAIDVAKQATSTIPIVMAPVGNPESLGLVASLARPGGNITGVSTIGLDLGGKQLELLKEAVSGMSRVAVLLNPTNPGASPAPGRVREDAARALGLTLSRIEARGADELDRAFAAIATAHPDALFVGQDAFLSSQRLRIVDFAAQHRLPMISMVPGMGRRGGLLTYGVSLREMFRQVAVFVDKLLKGGKPEEMPIEQVMRLELVINLKTAKAMGLTLPSSLLFQADEIIR